MHSSTNSNRLSHALLLALTVISMTFAATTANAACGHQDGRSTIPLKLPVLAQPNAVGPAVNTSIVGLWHVTYTSQGQLFYEAYDQWHADFTEFENADLSAVEGNVCMGVWKKVGVRTVQLNHVGWNFDSNGIPNGTFTLTETNTVSTNGMSYHGSFDYKLFDANGNLIAEATGTLAATRITAN